MTDHTNKSQNTVTKKKGKSIMIKTIWQQTQKISVMTGSNNDINKATTSCGNYLFVSFVKHGN